MEGLLYKSIADDLVSQIKKGDLQDNDRLSERGLAEEYGVSRTVVRDALKVLNEKGYVTIRQGKGHYVKHPDETVFRGKLTNIIIDSTIPFGDILEAREIIEIATIDLVMERATEKDIAHLEALYDKMNSDRILSNRILFSEMDSEFHSIFMSCCKNEMLMFFTKTLNDAINREGFMLDRELRINAQKEHRNMLDALKEHNADKMRKAFESHIQCIMEHVDLN